jgi:hypothetical protein
MKTKVYEIPGKLLVEWDSDAKAVIDTWSTYAVTLAEFKDAVLIKGVTQAKTNGVKAWIVDSSKAKGAFSAEIQNFIATQVFPAFVRIGVKHFITIDSESAITNLSVKQYSTNADSSGLNVIKGSSIQGVIEWLKKNA